MLIKTLHLSFRLKCQSSVTNPPSKMPMENESFDNNIDADCSILMWGDLVLCLLLFLTAAMSVREKPNQIAPDQRKGLKA